MSSPVKVDRIMWAVKGPEDAEPEMFFANEEWARDAIASSMVDNPTAYAFIDVFPVQITYERIHPNDRRHPARAATTQKEGGSSEGGGR